MATQNKAEFQTFNDGICQICEIDEDGNAGRVLESPRYQEHTVGVRRYYEAMTNNVQVDRLVRVPFRPWLSTEFLAVIRGQVYEIKQTQTIPDSLPKCTDLSLTLTRQRRVAHGEV